jgi:hypothetical protein
MKYLLCVSCCVVLAGCFDFERYIKPLVVNVLIDSDQQHPDALAKIDAEVLLTGHRGSHVPVLQRVSLSEATGFSSIWVAELALDFEDRPERVGRETVPVLLTNRATTNGDLSRFCGRNLDFTVEVSPASDLEEIRASYPYAVTVMCHYGGKQ